MKLFKILTLISIVAAAGQISADSGKGKIRTAVYDTTQSKTVEFKAMPNLSNNQFYSLVAKKTGIDHEDLIIRGVKDTRERHLSADKLAKFRNKPPRVTKKNRPNAIGKATRTITKPIKPIADVTVVPVADVTDDILLVGYRD